MSITNTEIEMLNDASTEVDWNAACDLIKAAREGSYPGDWFAKVIAGGILQDFQRRVETP